MKQNYKKMLSLCLIAGLSVHAGHHAYAKQITKTRLASNAKPFRNNVKYIKSRSFHHRSKNYSHYRALTYIPGKQWSQSGLASWYDGRRQSSYTASGERFNEHFLTAAHRSLPLGTKVLVRSNTGRSVVVTINDRGPFNHRIIDLSKAAAAKIGILHSGTARVTITPINNTEVAEAPEN